MTSVVAERVNENIVAEMDDIKILSEKYEKEAEFVYGDGDIEALTDTLSLLAERGIYRTDSLNIYIDIQETIKLLKVKSSELKDQKMKTYIEATLAEAEDALDIIGRNL